MAAVGELLRAVAAVGVLPSLAVLKEFGDSPSPGLLSFPCAGTTLALDFAGGDRRLDTLLPALDAIVAAAGGRLYPAKDARWPGQRFRAAYPRWREFAGLVDPRFSSGFWRRAMEGGCDGS